MTNMSITLNIDPSTNPELATAVASFLAALQAAGQLEGIQIDSGPSYEETDFVTFEDLVGYLKSLGLKNPLDKARRIWWNFEHISFRQVNPHLLIVCNACLLASKDCECSFDIQYRAGYKIGVQSLMSPQRINYARMSEISKERLQSFIEFLRTSRRDYPR